MPPRRLARVWEEKEAMAKVLERLQFSAGNSTSDREDWRIRDVVRTLEEQLVKERTKSQRSATKRCQEQRLLIEQVLYLWKNTHVFPINTHVFPFFMWPFFTTFLNSELVGGAESVGVSASCSSEEPHQWTGVATERVSQSSGVLPFSPSVGVPAFHVGC